MYNIEEFDDENISQNILVWELINDLVNDPGLNNNTTRQLRELVGERERNDPDRSGLFRFIHFKLPYKLAIKAINRLYEINAIGTLAYLVDNLGLIGFSIARQLTLPASKILTDYLPTSLALALVCILGASIVGGLALSVDYLMSLGSLGNMMGVGLYAMALPIIVPIFLYTGEKILSQIRDKQKKEIHDDNKADSQPNLISSNQLKLNPDLSVGKPLLFREERSLSDDNDVKLKSSATRNAHAAPVMHI